MGVQDMELYEETLEEIPCKHHWVLESPSGRAVPGICKLCGMSRQFYSAGVDMAWENDGAPMLQTRQRDTVSALVAGDI